MKTVIAFLPAIWLTAVCLWSSEGFAESIGADVAVVTGVSGQIKYGASPAEAEGALQAFQQLAENEIVELNKGATAIIVFFSGRKETWEGPVTLRILADRGLSIGASNSGTVRTEVPPEAQDQIEQLPQVMGSSRSAVTVVLAPVPLDLPQQPDCRHWRPLVLSPGERKFLDQSRLHYQRIRASTAETDYTAEAYWLSVLGQYERFDELSTLLHTLQMQVPGNRVLTDFQTRMTRCQGFLQARGG